MSKYFGRLALLSLVVISPWCQAAMGADDDKTYYTAQLGLSSLDRYANGISFVGTVGYKLPQYHKQLSVEGEFSTALMNPSTGSSNASYYAAGGYAAFTFPIDNKLNVRARAGLNYYSPSVTSTGLALGLGAGITYNYDAGRRIIGEFTQTGNLMVISAGMQFKF